MATSIIDKVLRIDAELIDNPSIEADLKIDNVFIETGFEVGGGGRFPYYDGEYVITPKAYDDQVLATKNKSLKDDIKVLVIPTDTVSNETGYTFAIAREGIELA